MVKKIPEPAGNLPAVPGRLSDCLKIIQKKISKVLTDIRLR
jgi:hypothetical protein